MIFSFFPNFILPSRFWCKPRFSCSKQYKIRTRQDESKMEKKDMCERRKKSLIVSPLINIRYEMTLVNYKYDKLSMPSSSSSTSTSTHILIIPQLIMKKIKWNFFMKSQRLKICMFHSHWPVFILSFCFCISTICFCFVFDWFDNLWNHTWLISSP